MVEQALCNRSGDRDFAFAQVGPLSLTIVYVILALLVRLVISTLDRICTLSVLRRDVSTIFASAIASLIRLIFSSR